jgi:predicted nucleic-acid-binding Zn-ribbon protein
LERENMEKRQYVCPKCGCTEFESDQFQATGGDFAKLFNVQNRRFVTVSCAQCGYTELYRARSSAGMNILDFLFGN